MKLSPLPLAVVMTAVTLASIAAAPARAEYRCATPGLLTAGERQACALARGDDPRALIRFVNRTKIIFGLLLDDYVNDADADRWQVAARVHSPRPGALAMASASTVGAGGNRSVGRN